MRWSLTIEDGLVYNDYIVVDFFTFLVGHMVAYAIVILIASMIGKCPSIGPIQTLHNILMSIFSGTIVALSLSHVWVHGLDSDNDIYQRITFAFFLSKYIEWIDTVFLILNGKDLIFLHVFHHAVTSFIFGFENIFPMTSIVGVTLNSFVHMIMYGYYASPCMSIRRHITTMQIVQFLIAIVFHTYMIRHDYGRICNDYWIECMFPLFTTFSILLLFLNFFVRQYLFKNTRLKRN